MNRAAVIALVLAAGGLLFFLRSSSSSDSSSSESKSAGASAESSSGTTEGASRGPRGALPTPKRMSASPREPASPGAVHRYTRNDGTIVRDHRAMPGENLERRFTLPKELSPVQPETLVAVRNALRPVMRGCIDEEAADAIEGSKLQAVLTVSVRDALLRVDKARVTTEGLAEEQPLIDCVMGKILGHEQQVEGAKDTEAHTMTFPYDL